MTQLEKVQHSTHAGSIRQAASTTCASTSTTQRVFASATLAGACWILLATAPVYGQGARAGDTQAFAASPLLVQQNPATEDETIRPFHINVSEEQLVILRKRIAGTSGLSGKRSVMPRRASNSPLCRISRIIGNPITTGAKSRLG